MEIEIDTAPGPARAHIDRVDDARGLLVLGHGAGGGVGARDLVASVEAARTAGLATALVEQPYRVAGRRSPAPARASESVTVIGHAASRHHPPRAASSPAPASNRGLPPAATSATGTAAAPRRIHPAMRRLRVLGIA